MRRNLSSIGVWLVAVAAAITLYIYTGGQRRPFPGVAGQVPTAVAPVQAGRLHTLAVKVGDTVKKGQVLARMDSLHLDSQITVAVAELAAAHAVVLSAKAQQQLDQIGQQLTVRTQQIKAETALAKVQQRASIAKAEYRAVSAALKTQRGLIKRGLIPKDRLPPLKIQHARLRQEVRSSAAVVQTWQAALEQAQALPSTQPKTLNAAPYAQVKLAKARLTALQTQRGTLEILAPHAGQVQHRKSQAGAVLSAGSPILLLVKAPTRQIRAWLPEQQSRGMSVGHTLQIRVADPHRPSISGRITRIAPGIEALPERLWTQPKQPSFGRPVFIQLEGTHTLLPGETVQVSLQ